MVAMYGSTNVTLRQVAPLFGSRSLRLTASSITGVQARLAGLSYRYQW